MLEHRSRRHFAQAQAMQVVAFDQALKRGSEHCLVAGGGVRAVGTGEGNAIAANDGDPAQ
ncbi:hypothetical protein D3C76_1433870 [compost metagenome]